MYWEKIDQRTAQTLQSFKGSSLLKNYYLSGGTALSLQLGHRISVDLDFFTQNQVNKIDSGRILSELNQQFPKSKTKVTFRQVDQLWLDLDGVKITFLAYPYSRKHPLVNEDGILLADIKDIALQKAFSIGRRIAARDYVDLAWILHEQKTTLEEINRDASDVFAEDGESFFSQRLFLQQLGYTDDLEDQDTAIKQLHSHHSFPEIMEWLSESIKETSRNSLMHPEKLNSGNEQPTTPK